MPSPWLLLHGGTPQVLWRLLAPPGPGDGREVMSTRAWNDMYMQETVQEYGRMQAYRGDLLRRWNV